MPHRASQFAFAAFVVLAPPVAAQKVDTLFVTVHGHRVALYVSGNSGPAVVLEAGGGSWHRDWIDVVPRLQGQARVIAYDRPGYALSEPCDSPRTAERVSHELRAALAAGGFADPVVLVGWSLGGTFARVFAGNFPELVSGLVLVDPAPEDFYRHIAREFPDDWSREVVSHFSAVYGDSTRRAEQRELAAFDASMEQARASDAKHRQRTIVLIAGRDDDLATDPISRVWVTSLTRWATTRPNATIRVVRRSGHHIPRQHPDAVAGAIREMLATRRR
jgi:pimeloyl-ACP methyl ester carboxylesterase